MFLETPNHRLPRVVGAGLKHLFAQAHAISNPGFEIARQNPRAPDLTELLSDSYKRLSEVSLDERGRNPDNAVTQAPERSITPSVLALTPYMRSIVELDDKLPRRSTEVDDKELLSRVTENHLAAKANAELAPFQSGPELRLERRGSKAHPSSKELETSAVALSGTASRRREGSERRRARHGQPFRPARGPGTTLLGAGAVPEARQLHADFSEAPLARGVRHFSGLALLPGERRDSHQASREEQPVIGSKLRGEHCHRRNEAFPASARAGARATRERAEAQTSWLLSTSVS